MSPGCRSITSKTVTTCGRSISDASRNAPIRWLEHDRVRTGALQLGPEVLLADPGHHAHGGIEISCPDHGEEAVLVVRQAGDHAPRVRDPCVLQDLGVAGIADHDEHSMVELTQRRLPGWVHLDHHIRCPGLLEFAHDVDGAVAAVTQDDVLAHLGDLSIHLPSLPPFENPKLDERGDDGTDRVGERSDPDQDEEHREDSFRRVERESFTVADGAERDDRHIERVEERPALDEHVTGHADNVDRGQQHDDLTDPRGIIQAHACPNSPTLASQSSDRPSLRCHCLR